MQTDFIKSSAPEAWDLQGTGSAAGAGGGSSSAGSAVNTQDTSQNFAGFTDIGSGFEGGNVLFRNSGYLRLGQGDNSVILDANDALYRVAVGSETYATAPFRVQKDGKFHAGSSTQYIDWDGTKLTIAGDVVQIDTSTGAVKGSLQNVISLTAGETISGATLPVAVFLQDSDNEVYACDANDTSKLDFIGFAITNGTDGNAITIQTDGVVSGFTGLTYGAKYYVQDDKTIGTTPGYYEVLVGQAVSTTSIFIFGIPKQEFILSGALPGLASDATRTTYYTGNNTAIFGFSSFNTQDIFRWEVRDGSIMPHNGSASSWLELAPTYTNLSSMACPKIDQNYIYTWSNKAGTYKLLRITISDQTITEMTISGTAPDNDNLNAISFDSSDNLYIADVSTTTVRKYTISGTTATYDSAITLSTALFSSSQPRFFIGHNNDFIYASSSILYKRDNSSGANQDTRYFSSDTANETLSGVFKILGRFYNTWNTEVETNDVLTTINLFNWK